MFPIDWLSIPLYIGMPLFLIMFGQGDLRKSDFRHLTHLQAHMFIPGLWVLVTSWLVLLTLAGVASLYFWRDCAASGLYDAALTLHWLNILFLALWMRLAKMRRYTIAAFIVLLLGVFGTALATLIIYGIVVVGGTGTWISFGVYILVPVALFVCVIYSGRVAFGDVPPMKERDEALIPEYQETVTNTQNNQARVNSNIQSSSSLAAPRFTANGNLAARATMIDHTTLTGL
jgi:tryptophan-rich sensory protein